MGNICDDLDKFLKTDGIKIIMAAGSIRTEPWEPLTVDDVDDFDSMNLQELDKAGLEDLLDKAEDLRDSLESEEPADEDCEEYNFREDRLSRTGDFIDRIRSRLDEPDEESKNTDAVTERIVWKKQKGGTLQ